ncbi:hypothetical protein KBC31_00260 [Candidatus Saccharibacteria bacterium]|nr:hypothetical protein [Candidatus Saccharibacteria bacterium]
MSKLLLPDQKGFSESRFLATDPAIDVILELAEATEDILAKEALFYDKYSSEVEIRETLIEDENGEKVNMKVLVVQGEDGLDGSGITLIRPPAWTDGPDTKGALRGAVTLSVMTGSTVVIPLFPGMGANGADKENGTKLTKLQKQSLKKGSNKEVAKMQWLAMQQVASSELGVDEDSNQKVVFFGYSLGNPQNAALLAEISEDIEVVGAIWAENPDIKAFGSATLNMADMLFRLQKSQTSPDIYGKINNILPRRLASAPPLDWDRGSVRQFYEMLWRDKEALTFAPLAVAKGSVERDLGIAREKEILKNFGHLIIQAGIRGTTLDDSNVLKKSLKGAVLLGDVVIYDGEDHGMGDSFAMQVIMVREFLKRIDDNPVTI